MSKVVKIVGYILAGILVVILGFVGYIFIAFPKVSPPKDITINSTPEMTERGKYLAEHVVGCIDCHSTRDWKKFAGPIVPGTEGKGGGLFAKENIGVPGTFYAKNITPTYLKKYSDGELYRLITTGVTKEGKAIFPLMPYMAYGKMDPEDVKAVISYIRTLSPKEGSYPEPKYDFPLNIIVRTIPHDATPMQRPSLSDTVKYGEYLATIAACGDCHTPMEKGKRIPEKYFAGGMEFKNEYGDVVRSANITQSYETGIGLWSEETFIGKFKAFRDSAMRNTPVGPHEFNSAMPWILFSGMKDEDLKAIYRFLQTIPPVENKVEKFTAAK